MQLQSARYLMIDRTNIHAIRKKVQISSNENFAALIKKHKKRPKLSAMIRIISFLFVLFAAFVSSGFAQQGVLINMGNAQKDLLKPYQLVFDAVGNNYHSRSSLIDARLYPENGEFSMLWLQNGQLLYPGALPQKYRTLDTTAYNLFDWEGSARLAIHRNKKKDRIAVFRSSLMLENASVSWEAVYFKSLLEQYTGSDSWYYIDEQQLTTHGLSEETSLLIIPAFSVQGTSHTGYMDQIVSQWPGIGTVINTFVEQGGHLYTEGNAVYMLEKAGLMTAGSVDFSNMQGGETSTPLNVQAANPGHPLSSVCDYTGNSLYAGAMPLVSPAGVGSTILATLASDSRPVHFVLHTHAGTGGKVMVNLGLPSVKATSAVFADKKQLHWFLADLLFAFSHQIDAFRYVRNNLPTGIQAGVNAVSYDREDTFEVHVVLRNLSQHPIGGIMVEESIKPFFDFFAMQSAVPYTINDKKLIIGPLDIAPEAEIHLIYLLRTPDPVADIHDQIDTLTDSGSLIHASASTIRYTDSQGANRIQLSKNYADIMFSARLFADADVNWKNFLYLDYQPFKVFMIMENKERTSALETRYVQFVPKDIPFYWSDQSLNIPILKTPGGKYVDVLRGSNDQANPEYDMDSDGYPDAWLDTASIYPKGYRLEEDEVYWANPWHHLKTGSEEILYEDIDHDGIHARDTNGDGIVDIEEPGDKIRVWKITWDINEVTGYQFYDPYCSYELWIDPPDLVPLAAGVGYALGKLHEPTEGMFYPFSPDIAHPSLSDTSWTHWMERDANGEIIWKQLIYQKIGNYEGFTFIDTLAQNYSLKATDYCPGTVPQPHREFLAVVSLGGEEIDMYHPNPRQSLYSNLEYKTIFDEQRKTPIRTTYTYYAPLPNPLQFEYLTGNYQIYDSLGAPTLELPKNGKASVVFDLDASTEYTYYWIRNVGYDVHYNDPSLTTEGIDGLGDGVFGYLLLEIPKGMGGYRMDLPRDAQGQFLLDSIVKVDGKPFSKWIDNPNTGSQVEIWEDPFRYQVYIPQILIPPALDDDNQDGTDDWIDDRGDRFQSKTGYLHDAFMPGNGEAYPNYPPAPFTDDIYGQVVSGWWAGADNTYGDDFFENLGKTHITIHANYEGKGREGSVDISKGATLVVEEIFGGSPWVIFSHVLSAYAKGSELELESAVLPSIIKYGTDTVFITHRLNDKDEPHSFDQLFDPFHVSYGHGFTTVTTRGGGKEPCSLISPDFSTSTIIDPEKDARSITLVPLADGSNPDLSGYPKQEQGVFLLATVEVSNGSDYNWVNTSVNPVFADKTGNTKCIFNYVAYPRPLVPAKFDPGSGKIVKGDDIGTFTAGWRFNQPEGEVLVKTGNTLNLMQPSRRAYYIFLFKIDPTLKNGIYDIGFELSSEMINYDGQEMGTVNKEVPALMFSITDKNAEGKAIDFQKLRIGGGQLDRIELTSVGNYHTIGPVKWATVITDESIFDTLSTSLPLSGETIDLEPISHMPDVQHPEIFISHRGIVDYEGNAELINLTEGQILVSVEGLTTLLNEYPPLQVSSLGPKIEVKNRLFSINGLPVADNLKPEYPSDVTIQVVTELTVTNKGSDISKNTLVEVFGGNAYIVLIDSLSANCTRNGQVVTVNLGSLLPGETKTEFLYYQIKPLDESIDNAITIIRMSDVSYRGTAFDDAYGYHDPRPVELPAYEFQVGNLETEKDGNKRVRIRAQATNFGLPAKNVWFRIYPVLNNDLLEFPVAQLLIDSFATGQTLDLEGLYTIPAGYVVDFAAKIDDAASYAELSELNNIRRMNYQTTGIESPTGSQLALQVYPNPAKDYVSLYLQNAPQTQAINWQIIQLNGMSALADKEHSGNESALTLNVSGLPSGAYLVLVTLKTYSGETTQIVGRFIKD